MCLIVYELLPCEPICWGIRETTPPQSDDLRPHREFLTPFLLSLTCERGLCLTLHCATAEPVGSLNAEEVGAPSFPVRWVIGDEPDERKRFWADPG